MHERPTPERPQLTRSRSKGGLETPLVGRLWRETRLIFAPPLWYDILTYSCLATGAALFAMAIAGWPLLLLSPEILIWTGPLVFFAGLWGQLSSERMTCDLESRVYTRREGQGLFKQITRGSLADLDAAVLLADRNLMRSTLVGEPVTYRLVLYWKQGKEPLLVIGTEHVSLGPGQAVNAGAGRMAQTGAGYARILGLPFFDNSYFLSDGPLKPF
ncbi:MAG: hypothetical protein JNM28_06465 [Armatimonadetes bacterium]|nr:hypothetical protein [Armatimonadota bacterium]